MNPFTLTFGKTPSSYIQRFDVARTVTDSFCETPSPEQVYIITGVRGSGKTVMLSSIAKEFIEKKDWIVIELNPNKDLLEGFAAELLESPGIKKLFLKTELSFSFHGVSFSIEGNTPVLTPETIIKKILARIKEKGKRVLLLIDEITSNQNVKVFASTFQSLLRNEYPLYLLMTGLYQNISLIENDPSLTFLYRAKKIYLEPLDAGAVSSSYQEIFKIDADKALKLAKLTNGFAYAYQALGYLLSKQDKPEINNQLLIEYDFYLKEYVYEKLLQEQSPFERRILSLFEDGKSLSPKEILGKLNITNSYFSPYRERLLKKGILISPTRGKLYLALPRFAHFLKFTYFDDNDE